MSLELSTAFLLGVVGSLHCAGMCGPLAMALPGGSAGRSSYLIGRCCYNSGRIVTYTLLGLGFGLVGKTLFVAGLQRWVSIGLGAFLLAGLLTSQRLAASRPLVRFVGWLKQRMGPQLRNPSHRSLLLLGLLNGLLPCGLVYVACAGATATAGILNGTLYMGAFGLGTVPMLMAISLSGRLVPIQWRLQLRKAVPISVCLLAGLLILRGMSLGIPYLSPDLSPGSAAACCHR